MVQDDSASGPDIDRLKVPEDLHRQLHEANARLHAARKNLEDAMEETTLIFRHEQNVEDHFGEVRQAEKQVEEITEKIQEILRRKA
jgi:hypothetical protein